MTPNEACHYFFEHLSQVRNSSDLLRLTLRVLPHLPETPGRPLERLDRMALRLNLDCSSRNGAIRLWYSANHNISTQLEKLEPLYVKGSSGPYFCSGLSQPVVLSDGPSLFAPGLALGVFAAEHENARKQLDAAQGMNAWWTTFLGHTPLWMRTAYHWPDPTPEQYALLDTARETMLAYASRLAQQTQARYNHLSGKVHIRVEPLVFEDDDCTSDVHWNALVAGQQLLHLYEGQNNRVEFATATDAMPGVVMMIKNICGIQCDLRGWADMGNAQVARALVEAEESQRTVATQIKVDLSDLDM